MITPRPANYRSEVYSFIIEQEGPRPDPYFDTANPPRATIGYGFNIEVREYLLLALDQMGITAGRTANETNTILNQFTAVIQSAPDGNDVQLKINLDALAQFYGAPSFNVSAPQSDNVFYNILGGTTVNGIKVTGKETRLDGIIGNVLPHDSKEYVALMSLFYNSEGLVKAGSKLATAVINGDRAEAWYEIRYNSNADRQHASRRYSEADEFALYNAAPTEDDYKSAYRMLTRHKDTILGSDGVPGGAVGYEDRFPPLSGSGLEAQLSLATAYFRSTYSLGTNIAWHDVLVDGDTSQTLLATDRDTALMGEGGTDTLIGKAGNDVLIGGVGNDTLYGGLGTDTYLYNPGDGHDTIEDSNGQNKILIDTATLTGSTKPAYQNQDEHIMV